MKIDITQIPIQYINMDRDKERRKDMVNLGETLGLENYIRTKGVYVPNHPKTGCATSHYNILSNISEPTLILEDDCVIASGHTSFEIPDDADAVYLGLSVWGYLNSSSKPNNFKYERHNVMKHLYRINGMLATHAILYISPKYAEMATRVAKWSADNDEHIDQGLALIQKYFNVYALGDPVFYQHSNTAATKIKLKGKNNG